MVDYDKILESGCVIAPRNRSVNKNSRTNVTAVTHRNKDSSRVAISIPQSICKELDLVKGESFNIVCLPSGKYCLCKVRPDLGYKLTVSASAIRTKLHYVYIPRLKTTGELIVEAKIEEGLIVFPEDSFA